MEDKKSYYAIIPASVRYDNRICPNAKLLYAEITALCNETGYCWAGNEYFAKLYDVSKKTITRWLNELEQNNYIERELEYKDNSKEILRRKIKLKAIINSIYVGVDLGAEGMDKTVYRVRTKKWRGTDKNVPHLRTKMSQIIIHLIIQLIIYMFNLKNFIICILKN